MTDPVQNASASDTPDPAAGSEQSGPAAGAASGAPAAPVAGATPGSTSDPIDVEEGSTENLLVEDLVLDLERVSAERDDYLDGLRRLQAEFENYRKAVAKREVDARERANDKIVAELLPVIDACDGAVANGAVDVTPVRAALVDALARLGLERLEPAGEAFDPVQHDAVMHEDSTEVTAPTVAEVLRVGYSWNGRVLRPAMVKTIG